MHIVKATDPIDVKHPLLLLFGPPGICKTSLGYSGRDTLLLDFDHGAHRAINRTDTVPIETWADMAAVLNDPATLKPYQTITIDTVGRLLDSMSVAIMDENPKWRASAGVLSLQGWGVLKSRYRALLVQLRQQGKDVVLLAHEVEEKDGDTLIVRPDIQGGSYDEVLKSADLVGYVSMVGKHRMIDFNPTDKHPGKNPAQWKLVEIPEPEKSFDVVALLLDKARASLGKISERSADVARVVDDWRGQIDRATSPQDLTTLVERHHDLAPIVQAQVKKLISDRSKMLGFVWQAADQKFAERSA